MPNKKPPVNAKVLLRRYAAGERLFQGADLVGAKLEGAKLEGANLDKADLGGATLTGVDLHTASLEGAELHNANLRGADLNRAQLQHASLYNADLRAADLRAADLNAARVVNAKLFRANLQDTKLGSADLSGADLREANLEGADLSYANLAGANCRRANFRGANLFAAHIRASELEQADMQGVNLEHTSLIASNLEGANLKDVELGETIFIRVDLSPFCKARSALRHEAASIIDHTSILRSIHVPGLKEFLVQTGMPEVFTEYMIDCARSMKDDVFKVLRSTFISYGSPDEPFARRLYEALHRNGVTTFFFPEHALPGKKLHRLVRDGVNKHDRVLLICSEKSLTRPGVLNEIEETLAREANDSGAEYLIPIRLDNYIFSDEFVEACNKLGKEDLVPALRRRVIGDFRDADKDDAKFTSELLKVLAALKK